MSLPDETLRKVSSCLSLHQDCSLFFQILIQIQQTAIQSQRAHSIAAQQTSAKERERRILQLTIEEIGGIKEDVNLYKGVGKMSVSRRDLCSSTVSEVDRNPGS